jgi:hypothetical protein
MIDKEKFTSLMKQSVIAHQKFKRECAKWGKFSNIEPNEVTLARIDFDNANDDVFDEISKFEKEFFTKQTESSINSVIAFCEIDIPAYRCGYAKQIFFKKLKVIPLNEKQKKRLMELALDVCSTLTCRVEIKELTRIILKIADKEFVEKLTALTLSSQVLVKLKSKRMLERLQNHRKDLFKS